MQLDEALERAVSELEDAQAMLRAAQGRVRELETIRDGLQFAVARYDKQPHRDREQMGPADETDQITVDGGAGPVSAPPGDPEVADTVPSDPRGADTVPSAPDILGQAPHAEPPSQSALTLAALKALGGEAATHQVRGRLVAAGYTYDQEQVRNALTYLTRRNRVRRVAPGMWALPTP